MQAKVKCVREFWDNGNIRKEEFRNQNGNWHKEDGPACRRWYENGQLEFEEYRWNGKLHNESGPAFRQWRENGKLDIEYYYQNGKWHNAAGPACRYWYANGQLESEAYYLNGKWLKHQAFLSECEFWQQRVGDAN
jgi:antitoxin component YwqK of YwqJK toxin-antitoxin module